jgi:uncharacterized protein YxjI
MQNAIPGFGVPRAARPGQDGLPASGRTDQLHPTIHKKFLTFTDAMEIEHEGAVLATVHKAVISPLHHRSVIDIPGGGRLEAVGNIIGKDFEIRDGRHVVARVSRAWFRLRDSYGVDVAPGQNEALMICIAICLDRIHHDEERRH